MKKYILTIVVILIVFLSVIALSESITSNKKGSENELIEYDDKILQELYIDNQSLMVMNSSRYIEDVINICEPSFKNENEYYYNIKKGKQLKIVTYVDGRIKGMYFDNKNKVDLDLYKKIKKCRDKTELCSIVDNIYFYSQNTTILSSKHELLENEFCEICFDNYDICKIVLDENNQIIDCIYIKYK